MLDMTLELQCKKQNILECTRIFLYTPNTFCSAVDSTNSLKV